MDDRKWLSLSLRLEGILAASLDRARPELSVRLSEQELELLLTCIRTMSSRSHSQEISWTNHQEEL